jgi:hypothetical protein
VYCGVTVGDVVGATGFVYGGVVGGATFGFVNCGFAAMLAGMFAMISVFASSSASRSSGP